MNNKIKKIFSIFLCAVTILSLFAVTGFAEDTQKTIIEAEITEDIIQANSEFMVAISVKNATELYSLDFDVRYDGDYLEFINFAENAYAPGWCNYNFWDVGHAQFDLTCSDGSFSGDAELIYIIFKASAEGKHTININVNSWQGKNQPENISFTFYIGDPDKKPAPKGLTYEIKDNEVTITGCVEEYKGRLDIPAEIDGYPVTTVADGTFSGCSQITVISVPATVNDITIGLIANSSALEKIIVDENNQYYSSDDHGVLFNKDKSKLLRYPVDSSAEKYTIPEGVTVIGESAFARAQKLKEITIPDTVTTIEAAAFLATWKLERIVIPDSVTKLTGNAFSCSGIKSAILPAGINVIETRVFDCCTSLESVIIPSNITHIDDFAFSMCNKLKDVYYYGSQEQWKKITVSDMQNSALTNANVHFDYNGFILYDVDGNGKINAADARLALRAASGLESLTGAAFTAADADGNGKINAADARKILRKASGLE